MKYTLIMIMLGLAGTCFAGQSVVASAPAPVAPAWGVELGGTYNFALGKYSRGALGDLKKNHVNTIGGDITGLYNIDENQAVTLRFGYGYGSDKFGVWTPSPDVSAHMRERLHSFTIMPGYRYTYALNDKWSLYAGANVGLAANIAKDSYTLVDDRRSRTTLDAHKSAWGFAWSIEGGAKYQINETVNVFAAVSYSGNTARPSVRYAGENWGKMRAQQYLGVRAGVGFSF